MIVALAAMAVAGAGDGPAGPIIVFSTSGVHTCACDKQVFPCAVLSKRLQHQRGKHGTDLVRAMLDSLGFFSARWDTIDSDTFRVSPGPRTVVKAETITGAPPVVKDSFSPPELPAWYDAGAIKERTAYLAHRMAECGYPFARIAVSISPGSFTGIVDSISVLFRIITGRECLFASPRLVGVSVRNHRLFLRDLTVREGEPFDLRKIDASREALARRPYVSSVTTGMPGMVPGAPGRSRDSARSGNIDYVAVPFLVTERNGLAMEGALGISSRQGDETFLQGNMTMSFLNVLHSGEQASLDYEGDKTYQKFNVQVSRPWLFSYPVTVSSGFGLEIREDVFGHLEGNAQLLFELLKEWRAGIGIKGSETTIDSNGQSWQYGGIDFLLSNLRRPLRRGARETWISVATGSGIASRERKYTRSHVDFSSGVHLPLFGRHALHARLSTMHLITDEVLLSDAEIYRVGGYRSVRGYLENEFSFRTVAYDQLEYLYYFTPTGSAFIFCDNGFGFTGSLTRTRWGERLGFAGYGLGIRVPARLGTVTVSWARNIRDTRSLGRLHLQVSNLAMGE
ncbi:MAG: hypothetical protein JXA71_01220 [Chitinispirillaceae bacterium]|nr:hypothetical protein [Chitinispirillaceae bacterium]